jgi:hypothetical protein
MSTFGLDTWGSVFNLSLQSLWFGFIQFAPRLLVAIVLFIIGWVLASLLAKAFEQVFASLKIDRALASVGIDGVFRKAGMNLNTGHFLGTIVKWFVVLVFLMPSLSLVGLDYIADFLKTDVLGFLPRVVVAALILIIATIIAEGVSKTVMASAKGMSLHSSSMLAAVAKYSIWIFAFIIALGQLGVAEYYMSVLFTGIIAMISLGAGLAFGLGGKEQAGRFLGKLSDEMSHRG